MTGIASRFYPGCWALWYDPVVARVGYVYDPLYLEHDLPGHPESAARLRAIVSFLDAQGLLAQLQPIAARDATVREIALIHSQALIDGVRDASAAGGQRWLDVDTYVVPQSYAAALRSAGGVLAATDAVLSGEIGSAFCLVRPPGHHAGPSYEMGFCLFDNIAIAAAHALARRGLERVAIVDFDVHHGNGTQDAFARDPRVLYFSTHQYPFYPGTGNWDETGAGNIVNVPLPRGCGDAEYLAAYRDVCAPVLRRFRPQLILVSAGFDAHFADPLAQELVSCAGYYEIAALLRSLAEELCGGSIVFVLEGGYDHTALAWSVRACIDALLGNPFTPDPLGAGPHVRAPDISGLLARVREVHGLTGN
jgi:acetoin utilization deacetylase AcuC-like enzyme